jgi:hypothetical protein
MNCGSYPCRRYFRTVGIDTPSSEAGPLGLIFNVMLKDLFL